jgi:excisionase family DNA binding protein
MPARGAPHEETMTHLTIREASQLIGRTPATIRRYIRSGRLKAEKQVGKFGEEYRIPREDLLALGFTPAEPAGGQETGMQVRAPSVTPAPIAPDVVPLSLYNELLMKHEQILVQYGMIRAGGQKLLEYKADAESKTEEIREARERYDALRQRALKEIGLLRKQVREMEIRLEERSIEVTLLQEKIGGLEPAPASRRIALDSVASSLHDVRQQQQAVAELLAEDPRGAAGGLGMRPIASGYPPLDRKDDH